jgi:hypothetical protein
MVAVAVVAEIVVVEMVEDSVVHAEAAGFNILNY